MRKLSADQPQGVECKYHTMGRMAEFTQLTAPVGRGCCALRTVKTSWGGAQQLQKTKQVPPLQPRPPGAMETDVFRKRRAKADAQQPDVPLQRSPQAGGLENREGSQRSLLSPPHR